MMRLSENMCKIHLYFKFGWGLFYIITYITSLMLTHRPMVLDFPGNVGCYHLTKSSVISLEEFPFKKWLKVQNHIVMHFIWLFSSSFFRTSMHPASHETFKINKTQNGSSMKALMPPTQCLQFHSPPPCFLISLLLRLANQFRGALPPPNVTISILYHYHDMRQYIILLLYWVKAEVMSFTGKVLL